MRIQVKTIQGLWISQYDVKKNWRLPSSLVSHDLKNSRLSRRSLDLLEEQDLFSFHPSLSPLSLSQCAIRFKQSVAMLDMCTFEAFVSWWREL